jgi:hypothetical protein
MMSSWRCEATFLDWNPVFVSDNAVAVMKTIRTGTGAPCSAGDLRGFLN